MDGIVGQVGKHQSQKRAKKSKHHNGVFMLPFFIFQCYLVRIVDEFSRELIDKTQKEKQHHANQRKSNDASFRTISIGCSKRVEMRGNRFRQGAIVYRYKQKREQETSDSDSVQ